MCEVAAVALPTVLVVGVVLAELGLEQVVQLLRPRALPSLAAALHDGDRDELRHWRTALHGARHSIATELHLVHLLGLAGKSQVRGVFGPHTSREQLTLSEA